jgi:hypothetical protein
VINLWPRYQPDRDEPEIYENYCYAKMILHHPFIGDPDEALKKDHIDWKAAYQTDCLDVHHVHPKDSLPTTCDDNGDDNVESDTESIQGENEDEDNNYRAEWMQEAARHPNQRVESDLGNLGKRDIDLEYDWLANSPDQGQITLASKWLADQIKESPNDDVQVLPNNVDYQLLKGEQRKVFLQVMAYFKKLKSGGVNKPPPLRINVDGTAGTGKSFLIWAITIALRDLYADELQNRDPVVRLAPTGVSAFGIQGWTINFGLIIPVKEGKEFNQLGQSGLARLKTRWNT